MASRRFRDNPGIQRYPSNPKMWQDWINEVARWIAGTDDLAYWLASPGFVTWRTDTAGVYPSGDPSATLTINFFSADDVQIASRALTGTLDSTTGNITVTDSSSSGKTTTYALFDDGSDSVRADVTVTLTSGRKLTGQLTWASIDVSASGSTPGDLVFSGDSGGGGGGGGSK